MIYIFYVDNGDAVHHMMVEHFELEVIHNKVNPELNYLQHNKVFRLDTNNAENANYVLQRISEAHPGKQVSMHRLERVGQCPAADYVAKRVDADGSILPLV